MADTKISLLSAGTMTAGDEIPAARSGANYKLTISTPMAAINGASTVADARTALGLGAAALLALADVDERARDAVGTALTEGAGIDITLNDGSDTITITVDPSEIEATSSQFWTGTSSAVVITPKKVFDAAANVTLTDGATITPDFAAGLNFKVTLAGNRLLANPTNAKSGQSGKIKITQDGTGSRTLTYGSNWRFPGGSGTGGVLSTTASAIDHLCYFVEDDGTITATVSKAFAV